MAVANSTEVAKTLIKLSATVEEADKTVEEYLGGGSPTHKEKLAFFKGLFGIDYVQIFGHDDDPDDLVYNLWLNAIIKEKYS